MSQRLTLERLHTSIDQTNAIIESIWTLATKEQINELFTQRNELQAKVDALEARMETPWWKKLFTN